MKIKLKRSQNLIKISNFYCRQDSAIQQPKIIKKSKPINNLDQKAAAEEDKELIVFASFKTNIIQKWVKRASRTLISKI